MSDFLRDYGMAYETEARTAEARRETAQAAERLLCNTLADIAATPDGLAFIRRLIGQSEILRSQYPADHAQAAYREGRRSMGAYLIALAAKAGVLPDILKEVNHDD